MAVDFEWINRLDSLPIYQCSAFTLGYAIDAFRPGNHEAGRLLHNIVKPVYETRETPPNAIIERSIYIHQCTLKGQIKYIRPSNEPYSSATFDIQKDFSNGQTCYLSLHSFWYFCKRQNWKVPGWHPHNINWLAEAQSDSALASEQQNTLDPSDLPKELDAANMAYRAVLNGHGSEADSFKNRLIDYLKTRYPHFTNDAVLRIATVANPDKAPGRKKQNRE